MARGETGDLFERVKPAALTVGELTRALKNALEPKFRDVWVAGEVKNLRRQASGHVYFTLKDDEASLNCVIWGAQARRIPFDLEDGIELLVKGFIEIYPPHGKYQLIASEVEPRGAGAQALLLRQLREKLEKEGLLAQARKRVLPFLPRRVGVATSPTGAALRDFLRVLGNRFPGLPVLIAPCRVQGAGAADTVVAAMESLCRAGVDVLVVTRGGGSQEDLWEFNSERLARAIAACPVPVVSAVGHEVDVSIADLVADLRAATPTHAAQLVAPVRDELVAGLATLRARLMRVAGETIASRRQHVRALKAELPDPAHLLSRQRHRLDDLAHRAEGSVRALLRKRRGHLDETRARLGAAEPRARLRALAERVQKSARRLETWQAAFFRRESLRLERLASRLEPANVAKLLSRGFSLVLKDGLLVKESGAVVCGESLRIVLGSGWLDVDVQQKDAGADPLKRPSK